MDKKIAAVFALLLAAGPASAEGRLSANEVEAGSKGYKHVDARVRASIRGYWDADAWPEDLRLNLHAFGNSLTFRGTPFDGDLWGSGNWLRFGGGRVSGEVNRWGNGYQVRAEVTPRNGSPRRRIEFRLDARGPVGDPKRPPSFSIWTGDMDLDVRPVFDGREYSISGWIDEERAGVEALALVCVVTAQVMRERAEGEGRSLPSPEWVEEAPLFRPVFK